MIDTHCHLLPSLDDGATSEGEAIQMARRLRSEGVRLVVCTPHFSRRYPTSLERARLRLARLRADLDLLGVELETELAAEVSPSMALSTPLEELAARTIGGRYLLVELQPATTLANLQRILARLEEAALRGVLAHPERCRAVQESPDVLEAARARGALVQVVAPSLVGAADKDTNTTAWALVQSGVADLVASDAHNGRASSLQLQALRSVIVSRCGEEAASRLLTSTPAGLLSSQAAPAGE